MNLDLTEEWQTWLALWRRSSNQLCWYVYRKTAAMVHENLADQQLCGLFNAAGQIVTKEISKEIDKQECVSNHHHRKQDQFRNEEYARAAIFGPYPGIIAAVRSPSMHTTPAKRVMPVSHSALQRRWTFKRRLSGRTGTGCRQKR